MKPLNNKNPTEINNCFNTGNEVLIGKRFANIHWINAFLSIESLMTNLALSRENTIYE
jgi:hypothetical protein